MSINDKNQCQIPTKTRWVDHGEEYEHCEANWVNYRITKEMENIVNDGLGGMSWDNPEEPNVEVNKFYKMLEDREQPLYPVCATYTKM